MTGTLDPDGQHTDAELYHRAAETSREQGLPLAAALYEIDARNAARQTADKPQD